MSLITIIIIAVGLAMDALAVSIASGAAYKDLKLNHAIRIALFFGAFQAFMPIIGSLAGLTLSSFISGLDHWLAFAILTVIGLKMIYESFKIDPARQKNNPANLAVLSALSIIE